MKKFLNMEFLNTFVTAAETRKLNVTAEITFRSASAVSAQIKNVENQIGRALFIRNKNMLTITKEGELLLKYAKQILDLNDKIFAEICSADNFDTLVFGVPTDYTKLFTERLYPAIKTECPQFHYSVFSSRSRELRRMLNEGKIQAAILAMEPQYLEDRFLWEEPLYWVGQDGYQIEERKSIPVAIFSDNCVMNNYAQYCLDKASFNYEVRYKSIMMDDIAQFVDSGLAIALLPESMISEKMKVLPQSLIECPYRLRIGFSSTEALSKGAADRIFDIIKENLDV